MTRSVDEWIAFVREPKPYDSDHALIVARQFLRSLSGYQAGGIQEIDDAIEVINFVGAIRIVESEANWERVHAIIGGTDESVKTLEVA